MLAKMFSLAGLKCVMKTLGCMALNERSDHRNNTSLVSTQYTWLDSLFRPWFRDTWHAYPRGRGIAICIVAGTRMLRALQTRTKPPCRG